LANLDNDLEKFIDVSILDLLYHNLCFVVLCSNILLGCQTNPHAFRESTLKDGCTTGESLDYVINLYSSWQPNSSRFGNIRRGNWVSKPLQSRQI
jgi:hypothetical protein